MTKTRRIYLERVIDTLDELLHRIGDINLKGGPGSKRAIKNLLAEHGIIPCPDCGNYVCTCPVDEEE